MSKFPLDLSKFKRVGSSDKETTLQHDDGHKLILNHSAIDQKKLSALSALPLLDQENKLPEKKMAEGGDPMPNPQPNSVPQEAPAAPAPAVPAPTQAPVSEDSGTEDEDTPEDTGGESKPAAKVPPQVNATAPTPTPAPQEKPLSLQEMFAQDKGDKIKEISQENAAIASDLANGHITAKSYGDLFADKNIFGKIGSIFGLLVGGAGAGLLHQENPLMGMWRQQINNDLDAQKAQQSNKQTLLSLNRQRLPDLESATNFTRMQANIMALHSIADQVEKLPPGSPQRLKSEQQLQTVGQFVNTENYGLMDQIATKQALMKNMQVQGGAEDAAFQAQQQALRWAGKGAIADQNEQHHIPGIPGMSSAPIPQDKRDEITAMNVLDNKAADILAFAKAHKGTLSPSQRAIGEQKAEEMINFYNNSIKGGVLTEGRLDWLDKQIKKNPTSIFQDILGNNSRLQEIQNSNNQRRNILLKSMGFQGQQTAQAAPQEIKRQFNGKTAVFDQNKKFLRYE